MDNTHLLVQTITIAIVAGISMQVLAEKLRLPSIAFLMIAGILIGPEFLGLVNPKLLGSGLEALVSLAVALILFEGGLNLDFSALNTVNKSIRNLLTIGLLITIALSTIAAHFILGLKWSMSLLFGALMSIYGPTVINPILQRVRLKRDIATILRSEGLLSDPIGAFVAVAVVEVILASNQQSWVYFCYEFLLKIVVGLAAGWVMGWLLGRILKRRYIEADLKNLVVLAWVFAIYFVSNLIESNTGILAVVIAGYVVNRENIPQINALKCFKGQLSTLFISLLFILISANLNLNFVYSLGWKGILVVVLITLVIRPISVFVSNRKLLTLKEKLFLSWIGPKGIVSASVASLFSLMLSKNGLEDAVIVESLVFLTIIITVILQGVTARRVAKLCDVLVKEGTIVIVGANTLGRTLATAFKEIGKEVTLIDSNSDHCQIAEEDELEIVCGNCLDMNVLEAARLDKAAVLIATTSNSEVNYIVSQMARDIYQVPEVYPAIDEPGKGVDHRLVDEIGGNLAYAKTVSIEQWKQAVDSNQVRIVDIVLDGDKGGKMRDFILEEHAAHEWIPLILKRKTGYFFVHSDQEWSKGDILIYLLQNNTQS